jgi:hypothetical protein
LLVDAVEAADEGVVAEGHVGSLDREGVILRKAGQLAGRDMAWGRRGECPRDGIYAPCRFQTLALG